MYQDMDKIARIADEIKSYIYTSMEQIEDIEFRLGEVVDIELEGNHPEYKPYLKNTMYLYLIKTLLFFITIKIHLIILRNAKNTKSFSNL